MKRSFGLWMALFALGAGGLVAAPVQAASTPDQHAAFIYNLGAGDFAGFRIAVGQNGKAWAVDGAGQSSGQLESDLVRRFFSDLRAAAPLQQLPAQRCASTNSPFVNAANVKAPLIITWNGKSSPDLSCAADARATNLRADALAVQRALTVQSYRVRTMVFGQAAAGLQLPTNYTQPSGYLTSYHFNGNGFSISTPAASYSNLSPETSFSSDNHFTMEPFAASGFSGERFSAEPFYTEHFSGGRFSEDHFSTEPFSLGGAFNNGGSDFGTNPFASGFSAGFGPGGFGGGGFGSGDFSNGGFQSGGFGGGNFNNGGFTTVLPGY